MIAAFRIEGLLGEGGMGRVYSGRSPGGRRVAVKVIRSEYAADPTFRKRFLREISAMKRVPGIFTAPVMDADADGSPPWLATAHIEGASLQDRVRADGPLPSREVRDLATSLAEALSAIHAEGLTHRDLKPSNVLLAPDGPKVIDFGLAVASDATLLTGVHSIGTPAYMSPEQCRGGRVEQPSDVFSLGGLLVYAATGQGPFGTGAPHELVYRVVHGEPQLGALDGPLREIVGDCLRRDPAARPTPAVLLARLTAITEAGAGSSGDTADMSGSTTTAEPPPRTRAHTHPFRASADPPPRRGGAPRAVGIDLGTHKSVVCVLETGKPTVIADAQGLRGTPSTVAFAPDGALLVGRSAEDQAALHPDRTVRSIGREMGSGWKRRIDGKDFIPQQISAFVLQKLKRDAEVHLGEAVTAVVITIPAHFSEDQRQAVKEAGQIAGLNVLRLIPAPSAVALRYSERPDDATIMIFDLGGGTLDVSLLGVGDGVVEVKATSGDNHLGGDDWDDRIVAWLVERFRNANGVDLSKDGTAPQRLREAAEKAKIALSSSSETQIDLPHITRSAAGPLHLDEKLTRAEFQRMTSDLLDRAKAPFHQVLKDAGIGVSDVEEVVLVGGSTRMPAVSDLVKELAGGKKPDRSVNPDEGVAIGASLQAGVLTGEVKDVLLLDVTPLSLGIETTGGVFTKIIERNTSIPTKRGETFTIGVAPPRQARDDDGADRDAPLPVASLPTRDGRPGLAEIHVYQGERRIAASNKRLGTIRLTGLPAEPPGVPQIDVCFDIDANGIINVRAKDLVTGKEQSMTITGDSALSQADIDRMRREARAPAS